MPTPVDPAVLESALALERFGFSNKDATNAAGKIAAEQVDGDNLTKLLVERYGFKPEEAKQHAATMLGDKKGWDVYPQDEAGLEDPLVRYVTSPEYSAAGQAIQPAKDAYQAKTSPKVEQHSTNEVYMQNPRTYDDRLAKAAALRQHILGY